MDGTRLLASSYASVSPLGRKAALKTQVQVSNSDWTCERSFSNSSSSFPVTLAHHNGKLICGSSDDSIRFWGEDQPGCLRTIRGSGYSLLCMCIWNGFFVSGSHENKVTVWSNEGEPKMTLLGHTKRVQCICVWQGNLVSGSYDKSIRVWNKQGKCERILLGHDHWITAVIEFDGKLISGSADCNLRVWNLEDDECEQVLEGHTFWIRCLCLWNERFVSGSSDCTIRVWKKASEGIAEEGVLEGHTGGVECVVAHNGKLISGSYDKTIRVWNEVFACEKIITGHSSFILCLCISNGKLFSGSEDKMIRVWNIPSVSANANGSFVENSLNGPLAELSASNSELSLKTAERITLLIQQKKVSREELMNNRSLFLQLIKVATSNPSVYFHRVITVKDLSLQFRISKDDTQSLWRGKLGEQNVIVRIVVDSLEFSITSWRNQTATLSLMSNKNLVEMIGSGMDDSNPTATKYFHVLDQLESNLNEVIYVNKESNQTLLKQISRQIAEGLAAIHSCGLMHGNLNPRAVLLDKNKNAKISGLLFGSPSQHVKQESDRFYFAPELLESDALLDSKMDVYSYGILIWELFAQQVPFKNNSDHLSKTISNRKTALFTAPPPLPFMSSVFDLNPNLQQMLSSCWELLPWKRPSIATILEHPFFK